MITINELTVQVQRALEKLQRAGIEGWGLNNPNEALFEAVQTSEDIGCSNETCNHVSHDVAAPAWKLIPREGVTLSCLTPVGYYGYIFYAARQGENVTLFRLYRDPNYWDQLDEVEADTVPSFVLARLGEDWEGHA